MSYIVFQSNFKGFQHIRAMDAPTLEIAIRNITEGCEGHPNPNQRYMYHIYKLHQSNVPVVGTRFDVYQRVKAVAGSKIEVPCTHSHEYALTNKSSMAWFFTDDIFGDYC